MNVSKMKKGLMVQYPCARGRAFVCKNIGDYVQSVATRQFVEDIDEYIEQEEANEYYPADKTPIRLIMNGWFQWRAENWPPSEYIHPLLVSMHISPLKANELLTPEGIAFLKKHGPVGCRDLGTKKMLESVGVPSYFSACLTLTLGKKYSVPAEKRKGTYIVDPYFEVPDLFTVLNEKKRLNVKLLLNTIFVFLCHPFVICKLGKKEFFSDYLPTGFIDRNRKWYRPFYKAALFYKTYSKKFSKNLLLDAEYITHWMDVDMSKDTNDDLLNIAEGLIQKYASAKLMITSRIHAGLPCLGLDTPIIFIASEAVVSENCKFNTPGRLGGLLDFFRIYSLEKDGFHSDDEVLAKLDTIDENVVFENKRNWEPYARELSSKCSEFMKD